MTKWTWNNELIKFHTNKFVLFEKKKHGILRETQQYHSYVENLPGIDQSQTSILLIRNHFMRRISKILTHESNICSDHVQYTNMTLLRQNQYYFSILKSILKKTWMFHMHYWSMVYPPSVDRFTDNVVWIFFKFL